MVIRMLKRQELKIKAFWECKICMKREYVRIAPNMIKCKECGQIYFA